jgi:hypothetical protein
MTDITIVEVSPRNGLQNQAQILSTEAKVELITRLVDAGARRVEAVAFAQPKLVPTMADAEAVMERVPRRDGIGGCPFAPKAGQHRHGRPRLHARTDGLPAGIDLTTLLPTAPFLGEQLGNEVPAPLPRAARFPGPRGEFP